MSIHGTHDDSHSPDERGAGGTGCTRGAGYSPRSASITLIGDDGTEHGVPRLDACRDPQLELPPLRLTCPPDCSCWVAIERGEVTIPRLSRGQLVEWMAALAGPLRSGLAHNRMYHHERSTKPESPLNVGYVGVARGLGAFGITPGHYRQLKDAVRETPTAKLADLFGGQDRAAAFGLALSAHRGLVIEPQVVAWNRFCPLVWQKGGDAAERLLGADRR